jgi:hypothetical protein
MGAILIPDIITHNIFDQLHLVLVSWGMNDCCLTPNEQILLMMFVILRRTVKKKDFELLWWVDACGQ